MQINKLKNKYSNMTLTYLKEDMNNMHVLFVQSRPQIFCMPHNALEAFRNNLLG